MEDYIINGLRVKDEEILQSFIDEYGTLIYNAVKSVLCHAHEREYVEECIDDVIMLVWNNIDLYNHRGKFKAWLISVARFKAIDYKRKYKKNLLNDELKEGIQIRQNDIEEKMIFKENLTELKNFFQCLSELDRKIIEFKYIKGFSTEEISQIINFSPAFIYNRLSRAKKKLQSLKLKEMRESHE